MKKKLGIFIENYLAGGCDVIARDLIDNLQYDKLYLFVNRASDLKILLKEKVPTNVEIVYYNIVSLHELGVFANSWKSKNRLFYIFLKVFNLLIRYPLILFYFLYFYFIFKPFDIDILFSNNGGYPGGEFNRIATLSFSVFKKPNFHIVHNLATKPFFKPFTPIEFFIDRVLDRRSTFICVSNQTKEYLLKNRNITQEPIIISNGIKTHEYNEKKENHDTIKLLNIGLLGERKNQLQIIESMKILHDKGYTNLELYLLGDEEDIGYKNLLLDTIKRYQLNNIHLEGFCDPSEYYEKCDLFILSSCVESFALVRVEAMSYQMPVITTDVGDASFQIENDLNGYIVNDTKEMAASIEKYIKNPQLIQIHGKYGYDIFENRFTLDKMVQKYQHLVDGE